MKKQSNNQSQNKTPAEISGIRSGFEELDQLTGGWQKGQLTLIASLSSLGKTSLMAMFAHSASKENTPTLIFNLESPTDCLVHKMICTEARVEMNSSRSGQLTREEFASLEKQVQLLNQRPIFIDDSSSFPLQKLKTKIMRFKVKHDIQLVCIDFIQFIEVKEQSFGSRSQELAWITEQLKKMASELQISIIAVVQLNRSHALERRPPCLADLEATKNADTVLFLHRVPEDTQGITQLILAKNKAKPTNVTIPLQFIGKHTYFKSLQK
ncbi:DnaB-like helicase C-terminal domain-containing protein [uncultured Microscilla sp.]|uniref:DnaB-like helicase C-terminal domain-containing protein n=1 Tax=uncultured Microscilla sp. TaxID=432653 RepID=UPI00261A3F34|nr:DnaB-like helicase C-terminal domain-containing protein [uncultured Microscilla sp.]